jgi:Malectin domain/PQQ-like domain
VGKYFDVTRHFSGASEVGSNYVSMADGVYVLYQDSILELDPATGATAKTFYLKGEPANVGQQALAGAPGWGSINAWEDLLIATSDPVAVETIKGPNITPGRLPVGMTQVIDRGQKWRYLVADAAPAGWADATFDDSAWAVGTAEFRTENDVDDPTKVKRGTVVPLHDRADALLLRYTFNGSKLADTVELAFMVNFSDGFIARLNGKEIARANIDSTDGHIVKVRPHAPQGFELFVIRNAAKLIHPGANVLAIEARVDPRKDTDLEMDAYLVASATLLGGPAAVEGSAFDPVELLHPAKNAAGSRRLVVIDRHSGQTLWQRDADFAFRHNTVVAGKGLVFCIDGVSPMTVQSLRRRGVTVSNNAKLLALDARTGRVVWSTTEDAAGTFLSYSAKCDVLLQAGSAYRDRARDETDRGMVAYRGRDGHVLWKDMSIDYGGPCLLWHDTIITNGAGGFQLDLLTGKRTGWTYKRMYGCNTAVASEHLLTFRSAAAGFCDLTGGSGTGNLGGFRSGCTSNLIVADGVLNAPDYTRTCKCAYQNQSSLAFIPMPDAEMWTFAPPNTLPPAGRNDLTPQRLPASGGGRRLGVNFGAPGDRRADNGTLWLDFPSVGGPSPKVDVKVTGDDLRWFRRHALTVAGDGLAWVEASGGEGVRTVRLDLAAEPDGPQRYTLRLYFCEPDDVQPGERVFSVAVQGDKVIDHLDVAKEAGGAGRGIVREFKGVNIGKSLEVALTPSADAKLKAPVLSGLELIAEAR